MSPQKPEAYTPSSEFSSNAHIRSAQIAQAFRETAQAQPEAFWKELSRALQWQKSFTKVLEWSLPTARWFGDGQINLSENCLDRHLRDEITRNKTAFIWEGEPTDPQTGEPKEIRRISYADLSVLVNQIANSLIDAGIKKGDRVAIYMPLVPETAASMLACARIGAVHTVVFGGFSANALADRIEDSKAKLLITADGTYRKGQWLDLKKIADEALGSPKTNSIKTVFVYRRDRNQPCNLAKTRDWDWEKVLDASASVKPATLDAEDPLFILYTSGTTGKPKGLFHTNAGYLLWAHWTSRWLFDLKAQDVYWCTADFGWITGHTYVVYGPLSNGATVMLYEGAPLSPDPSRFWKIIDRHSVTILYTSPTAIRTFMRHDPKFLKTSHRNSLRLLGSVGEPINPEAWRWFYKEIGNSRCPIVDTYWQTETGGVVIANFPGAEAQKLGFAGKPLPGIEAEILAPQTGYSLKENEDGVLVLRKPWPSMARGIWGDPLRYEKTYWNTSAAFQGLYVSSDFASKDTDGDFSIRGRMDDVMNISGHRIGSAEVESALVAHPAIAEAGAVGVPDPVKGQGCIAFVILKENLPKDFLDLSEAEKVTELRNHVGSEIGGLAKPDQVKIVKSLPKTRSGKILRRLLRELALTGTITGDTTTLDD